MDNHAIDATLEQTKQAMVKLGNFDRLVHQYVVYNNRNLKVRFMGPFWTTGFSILPVTKITPQATQLHEPSTGNCGYSYLDVVELFVSE